MNFYEIRAVLENVVLY